MGEPAATSTTGDDFSKAMRAFLEANQQSNDLAEEIDYESADEAELVNYLFEHESSFHQQLETLNRLASMRESEIRAADPSLNRYSLRSHRRSPSNSSARPRITSAGGVLSGSEASGSTTSNSSPSQNRSSMGRAAKEYLEP
jgi:ABC-type uncharacterized transport system involved in gliding motility auxiliary subunit